jgi:hypothetical protein
MKYYEMPDDGGLDVGYCMRSISAWQLLLAGILVEM